MKGTRCAALAGGGGGLEMPGDAMLGGMADDDLDLLFDGDDGGGGMGMGMGVGVGGGGSRAVHARHPGPLRIVASSSIYVLLVTSVLT